MDRNNIYIAAFIDVPRVALRKESVDRNKVDLLKQSAVVFVALRKESVDRNTAFYMDCLKSTCRSPQGERG